MTKQVKEFKLKEIQTWDFETSVDKLIEKLQSVRANYPENELRIEVGYRSGYYDSIDVEIEVFVTREETDAEYAERTRQEDSFRQAQLAYKRQQLANLKRELGEE